MTYAIGIDIGVTNIKSLCITPDSQELSRQQTETLSQSPDWPTRVAAHIQSLIEQHGPTNLVGIAAPGIAARDGRCISWMQGRLAEVEGLIWTDFLHWPRPIPVLNDAQAALLGETWKGAAIGATNAILLTLGTGVGGAILANGQLLKGHIGRAGHLGHISLNPDGPPSITNCPGSLEYAIGNYTISERSNNQFPTTHALVAAHRAGHKPATEIWLQSIKTLAAAIASFINILDPEVVILGGGIAIAGDALLDPLNAFLDQVEWRPHNHRAKITLAQLGEFAGAFGAAKNALDAQHEEFHGRTLPGEAAHRE